jgi:hypothetical protein
VGRYLNIVIALLILAIVAGVCSHYFYNKGKEEGWALARQLVPLRKGEIYLCVERSGDNGVPYLTVEEIGRAARDQRIDQKELRFRLNLALNNMSLQDYNDKYRQGKRGM